MTPGRQAREDAALQVLEALWLQVCAWRGTPAPERNQAAGFIAALAAPERQALQDALTLAAQGREPPGALSLISWAASCTRPALLAQLASHGLAFTGATLFACALALTAHGWDMPGRLAQLAAHPEDVVALREYLAGASAAAAAAPDEAILDAPWVDGAHEGDGDPWLGGGWGDDSLQGSQACSWEEPPALPTRFERLAPGAPAIPASAKPAPPAGRLRLFGKSAAHTLEVSAHRRGSDFSGVHVVSIDSAPALPAGAGYDWARKLTLQLTPEEMPAVLAVLMGLAPAVRFAHHGPKRDKFFEVRRQASSLVIVTGQQAVSLAVPVPVASGYYVLALFCRAMAMGGAPGQPALSVSDVLGLARSAHGL